MIRWLAVLLISGCTLSYGAQPFTVGDVGDDPPQLSEECIDLDNAYIAVTAVGTTFTGLSAGANMALAVWPDPTRDELIGIGVAGVASGVIGGAMNVVGSMLAQRFVERCGGGF